MTAKKKTTCYTDFLEGASLRQISASQEVSIRTLERWCSKESWVEKREAQWFKMKQEICSHKTKNDISEYVQRDQKISSLIDFAFDEYQLYMQGKIPRKALKLNIRDFVGLAKAYSLLSEKIVIQNRRKGEEIPPADCEH